MSEPIPLNQAELDARLAALDQPEEDSLLIADAKFARFMPDVANDFVRIITDDSERFMFGLTEIDAMTRGIGSGELCMVIGLPHSGKTQIVLQGVANNLDKRGVIFTPDEVAELVLSKLVSMILDISAEEVEHDLRTGNTRTKELVQQVAKEQLTNLVLVDRPLDFANMAVGLGEAEDYWGDDADFIVMDYLELFSKDGESAGVTRAAQETKSWGKQMSLPIICLHQSGMSKAPRGRSGGMDAMRYGGTAEAIYVMEVFRRSQDTALDPDEIAKWSKTLTVNLSKNKRPPSRTGIVDLYIDPDSGLIRKLHPGDMDNRPPIEVPADAAPEEAAQMMLEDF